MRASGIREDAWLSSAVGDAESSDFRRLSRRNADEVEPASDHYCTNGTVRMVC
jgi:hypothetical protein